MNTVRVLGWLLVASGIIGVLFPVVTWSRVRASRRWPSVEGRVIESALAREAGTGDRGSTYQPRVRYRYVVEGQEHVGDQVDFGVTVGGSQWIAERTTRRYPEGSQVTVYYDPEHPSEAVLDRAFPLLMLIQPPVGLFLARLGYILLQR